MYAFRTRFFLLVRDNAPNEVRMRLMQHRHEIVERLTIDHRNGHERARFAFLFSATATTLIGGCLLLRGVVGPDLYIEKLTEFTDQGSFLSFFILCWLKSSTCSAFYRPASKKVATTTS